MAPAPYGNGSADTFASLRRHGEYYLTGGDLFVLVRLPPHSASVVAEIYIRAGHTHTFPDTQIFL